MIEHVGPTLLESPAQPRALLYVDRAVLPCGCGVAVGILLGTTEVATGAWPCSPAHDQMIEHLNLMIRESTVQPQLDRLAIDVCDELLTKTADHYDVPR